MLSTLKVVVVAAEPPSATTLDALHVKKRQRVKKWIRNTFDWCISALTLRCLRHKRTSCRDPALANKPSLLTNFRPIPTPTAPRTKQSANAAVARGPASFQSRSSYSDDNDDLAMRSARLAAMEIEWFNTKLTPKPAAAPSPTGGILKKTGAWSDDEHERYCEALRLYRYGSWKQIAEYVGTRTERQVLSHVQSIRAKEKRAEERKKRHLTETAGSVSDNSALTQTRNLTPVELLAASMDERNVANLPPEVTNRDELQQRSKRSKPNSDSNLSFDAMLGSSSLDMLLDGILGDEDLFEHLEIPSIQPELQSAVLDVECSSH